MYSPVHASLGGLIATVSPNAPVAFGLGVISHYLLDAVPHGDLRPLAWLARLPRAKMFAVIEPFDLSLAVLIVWFLTQHLDAPAGRVVAGAIGAVLPDMLWGGLFVLRQRQWRLPGLMGFLEWHNRWHERLHVKQAHDIPHAVAIAYQLAYLMILVLLLQHR